MIAAMVLWTAEKGLQLFPILQTGTVKSPFVVLIWWAVFMHAFYLAFRVEMHRRRRPSLPVAVFD